MNTQQRVNCRILIALANELNLACTVWADGGTYTLTMDTGEVEPAEGLPRAMEIVRAYAALGGGRT